MLSVCQVFLAALNDVSQGGGQVGGGAIRISDQIVIRASVRVEFRLPVVCSIVATDNQARMGESGLWY
jgi:hypothetical protein